MKATTQVFECPYCGKDLGDESTNYCEKCKECHGEWVDKHAKLIAAAPELLMACRLALEHLKITDNTEIAQTVLMAAIKSAE